MHGRGRQPVVAKLRCWRRTPFPGIPPNAISALDRQFSRHLQFLNEPEPEPWPKPPTTACAC